MKIPPRSDHPFVENSSDCSIISVVYTPGKFLSQAILKVPYNVDTAVSQSVRPMCLIIIECLPLINLYNKNNITKARAIIRINFRCDYLSPASQGRCLEIQSLTKNL